MGNKNAKIIFFTTDLPSASGKPKSLPGKTSTTSGSSGLSTGVTLRH